MRQRRGLTMSSSDTGPMLRIRIFVMTSMAGPGKNRKTLSDEQQAKREHDLWKLV